MNQPSKATKQRTVIGLRANGLAAAALSATALFSVSADAVAQHYIFTDLGTLGGTESYATGIHIPYKDSAPAIGWRAGLAAPQPLPARYWP